MRPQPLFAVAANRVPAVFREKMPLVEDQLRFREAALGDKRLRPRRLAHGFVGIDAVPVPAEEIRRDTGLLARGEKLPRKRLVKPRKRGPAKLQFREFAFQPLQARDEEIDELGARSAPARRDVRLVEKLPVLDVPLEAVRPAARVVADDPGEGLGVFRMVWRIERVDGVSVARVLDRRAKAIEDLHPVLFAHGLEKVVRCLEVVVRGILRVEMH